MPQHKKKSPLATEPKSASQRWKTRSRSLRWVLRQTWAISPRFLTTIVALTLLQGLFPAALASIAKALIDNLTAEMASSTPNSGVVMPWLVAGLILAAIDATATGIRTYLSHRLADDLNLELTTNVLTHAASLDIAFFENVDKQDTLHRANKIKGDRFIALINQFFGTLSSVLQAVSLSAILIYIEPWTLAVISIITPPFLLSRWLLARREYELEYNRTTKHRWTSYFVSLLTKEAKVAETRLLGIAPALIRKHHALFSEFRDQNRTMYQANLRIMLVFSIISTALFYALIVSLAIRALAGTATLGDVAVFFAASGRLRGAIMSGVRSSADLVRGSLFISNLVELLEKEKPEPRGHDSVPADCTGAITIEHLNFTYSGSSNQVIRDLSLDIRSGETVALVGENGCGKTTLVKLIANLYSPTSGSIMLDGRPIDGFETRSLHQQISFVFQRYGRYEASAADNIAYGDWEQCENNRERVEAIAREAGIHDMILAMPDGYDTLLGRAFGTHDLSEGQWQKFAIARAIAGDSSLLILDEPTASLDARAEYDLFVRTRKLTQGKTTILISHRFSTVSMADRILVMDQGRIIEQGSHQELLRLDGQYADLYRLHQRQTGSFDDTASERT